MEKGKVNMSAETKVNEMLQQLRNELNQKKYALNTRFPSEYDLAERFEVNKKTANKAVSLLTVEGYLKRGRGKQGTIVVRHDIFPKRHIVFIGDVRHHFMALEAYGVQAAALKDNSLVSLISPPPSDLNRILKELPSMKIDGIIATSYGLLPETGLPVVYLENQVGELAFPDFVSCDSYQAGYQMMRELLKRGHRNIVLLFQIENNPQRLHGYYDAMREAGITDYEKRTFHMLEYTVGETNLLLNQICRKYPGFTAIVSCSDDDIHRMIISMRLKKMDWEGKIAMIGFGNLSGVSDVYPIASVDQHPVRIGAEAYRLLLKKISNPETAIQEFLDTELVNLQNIPNIKSKKTLK